MLIIDSLTKVYDTDLLKKSYNALNNLSFSINKNSIIGFLGANGAGKTTTIKIILDFVKASSGRVIYSSDIGNNFASAIKNIGYLPERPYFYPNLKAREFLIYLGSLSNIHKNQINEQISYWAPRLKIEDALDRKILSYSKGMLQRLGFLSAVLHRPKLLILDEPASGLDPVGRMELKEAIKEVNGQGVTIFFSTHIVSDVEEICDQIVFVKDGRCAYQGSLSQIILNNSSDNYNLKYFCNESLTEEIISGQALQQRLKEVIDFSGTIISLERRKLTLEEIVYHASRKV